jgi:SAM-dependent methyltransferase
MNSRQTVVILSGGGAPAVAAANLYFERLSPHFRVLLVGERTLSKDKIILTLQRRWRKSGLTGVLDLVLLRILYMVRGMPAVSRRYEPVFTCDDINAPEVLELLARERPDWIITNACSIVGERIFQAVRAPMLNVHNGITPRYRGTGNFWAVREDNPSLFGVTVHRLDRGIDTGERIAVAPMDVHDPRCATLAGMDIAAFEEGAKLVCKHILENHVSVPSRFSHLPDRYYSYPGLTDWLAARRNLACWRARHTPGEAVWKTSFADYAEDGNKDPYQRMHWAESETVHARDAQVLDILSRELGPGARLLDLGGGDGRMAAWLPNLGGYVCADYTHAFMRGMQHEHAYPVWAVQCDARALPFRPRIFDAAIAVGLFQHITEVQRVVDEMCAAVRPGGLLVVNTLRQFSRLELVLILAGSLLSPLRRTLTLTIMRRDYFSGASIAGTLVARRYSHNELLRLFNASCTECKSYSEGLFGTRMFSREITLVLRRRN